MILSGQERSFYAASPASACHLKAFLNSHQRCKCQSEAVKHMMIQNIDDTDDMIWLTGAGCAGGLTGAGPAKRLTGAGSAVGLY